MELSSLSSGHSHLHKAYLFNSNLSSCIKIFTHIKNARLHSEGRVQEE
jgi:hypothetical protein